MDTVTVLQILPTLRQAKLYHQRLRRFSTVPGPLKDKLLRNLPRSAPILKREPPGPAVELVFSDDTSARHCLAVVFPVNSPMRDATDLTQKFGARGSSPGRVGQMPRSICLALQ